MQNFEIIEQLTLHVHIAMPPIPATTRPVLTVAHYLGEAPATDEYWLHHPGPTEMVDLSAHQNPNIQEVTSA
jgi:hypothetical protein